MRERVQQCMQRRDGMMLDTIAPRGSDAFGRQSNNIPSGSKDLDQHIGPVPRTRLLRSVAALVFMIPLLATFVGSASVTAQSSLTQALQTSVTARMRELRVPGAVVLVQDPDR